MISRKLIKKNYEMILIAKKIETYVSLGNNHVPKERNLSCFGE
jgi:hypothetical protein